MQQAVSQPRIREARRRRHQQRHGENQAKSGHAAASSTSFESSLSQDLKKIFVNSKFITLKSLKLMRFDLENCFTILYNVKLVTNPEYPNNNKSQIHETKA